jgi:hypothetical protein
MRPPLRVQVRHSSPNKKGATCRSRLSTINCLYTFRISNWKGQTGNGWQLYIVIALMELSPIA